MPTTSTEKKNINSDKVVELEKKNKELESKMDTLLSMMQSLIKKEESSKENLDCKENTETENVDTVEKIPEEVPANKNIKLTSLCYGTLVLSDGNTPKVTFTEFGQTKNVLYSTLVGICNTDTSFAETGKFYIENANAVYHLDLSERYKSIYNLKTINNLTTFEDKRIRDIVSNMNDYQKELVVSNIVIRKDKGENFDLNKVKIIEECTGIDIDNEYDKFQRCKNAMKKG